MEARILGVGRMLVARVWRRAGLQPHRFERYMLSDDPDFERKAADVLGLYLHPPRHAAVFSVDDRTAIQALDRPDPVLPLSPGRADRLRTWLYRMQRDRKLNPAVAVVRGVGPKRYGTAYRIPGKARAEAVVRK